MVKVPLVLSLNGIFFLAGKLRPTFAVYVYFHERIVKLKTETTKSKAGIGVVLMLVGKREEPYLSLFEIENFKS